ncbi:rRNA biogenesis protein rrp36-like [Nymphaea colorata]|nr:rRNA biogenesis protein rrp36-like [Nymphaea colorata]
MGCFIACFGGSSGRKGRKPTPKGLPRNTLPTYSLKPPTSSLKPTTEETLQGCSFLEPREKPEKPGVLISRSPKKVTFDLQVRTYAEVPSHEEPDFSSDEESKGANENELEEGNESQSLTSSEDHSTTSTTCSFPTSHRYQNCRYSDDEDDSIDDGDLSDDGLSDDDVADDEHEDLFEWYSSSSFESQSKSVSPEPAKTEANELVTRPTVAVGRVRDRSQYVHPVLNAVENRSQWQALKSKESKNASVIKERKENIPRKQEPVSKFSLDPRQEPRVDASLSSWLVPSEPANYAAAPVNIYVKSKDGTFSSSKTENRPVLVDVKTT